MINILEKKNFRFHSVIENYIVEWVNSIALRDGTQETFETTTDTLVSKSSYHLLPEYSPSEIITALSVLVLTLMSGIQKAKKKSIASMNKKTDESQFEIIIDQCKLGFLDAKKALYKCINKQKPNPIKNEINTKNLYALYALLEDFEEIESSFINKLIIFEDIQRCPVLENSYRDFYLETAFNEIFEKIDIEDRNYLLSGIDDMLDALCDNPYLLALISDFILSFQESEKKKVFQIV